MGSKTFEKHAVKIRNKDMSFENPSTETDFCGQNGAKCLSESAHNHYFITRWQKLSRQ